MQNRAIYGIQAAWEKLHTGVWKDVLMAWRDLYSLACLLLSLSDLARLSLPPAAVQASEEAADGQHVNGSDAVGAAAGVRSAQPEDSRGGTGGEDVPTEQAGLAAAMRELDLAVIMGGLRFRPWVDAAIQMVQQRHVQLARQALSRSAETHADRQQTSSKGHACCIDSAEPERPTKFRRTLHNSHGHRDGHAAEMLVSEEHSGDSCGVGLERWPKSTVPHALLPAGGWRIANQSW